MLLCKAQSVTVLVYSDIYMCVCASPRVWSVEINNHSMEMLNCFGVNTNFSGLLLVNFHSVIIPHFKVNLTPLIYISLILDGGKQIRNSCLIEVSDYCIH